MRTEVLIAGLAADARPVAPLPPPWRRASLTLAAVAAAGLVAILLSDPHGHLHDAGGRVRLEMAAMLATGLVALSLFVRRPQEADEPVAPDVAPAPADLRR